jgi:hypothetical protein
MAGAGLGEYANQKLGITEESAAQVGLAMAAPAAFRTAAQIGKGLVGGIVKSFGGRQLVAQAAESLFGKTLAPAVGSAELAGATKGVTTPIATGSIATKIADIERVEAAQADTAVKKEILDSIAPLKDYVRSGSAPADALHTEITRVGSMIRQAYDAGKSDLGRTLTGLKNSMYEAFDQSGVPEVRQFAQAYRKEEAIKDLGNIAGKAKPVQAFADRLKDDKLFAGSFSDAEKEQINRVLNRVSTATFSGFSGIAGRAAVGFGLGDLGGATVGIVGAAAVPELVGQALATRPGRALLEKVLADPNRVLNIGNFSAVLGSFARAQMAEPGKADFKAVMQNRDAPVSAKIEAATARAQARQEMKQILEMPEH